MVRNMIESSDIIETRAMIARLQAANTTILTSTVASESGSDDNDAMTTAPSREEVDAKIGRASAEFNSSVSDLRKDMDVGFAGVRSGFAEIRQDMAIQSKETVKWVVGTALAILAILLSASIAIFSKIDRPQQPSAPSPPIIINVPGSAPAPAQTPSK